ncbi:MAG TPA: prephenate dehydrogenase [Cytophagales bacterium]|nr:prephenate dehydrogenase [Cytophagales bacterium]
MTDLGFVGFGNFGKFFIPHLKPYFTTITVFDTRELYQKEAAEMGIRSGTLQEVLSKSTIILAIPVQYLASFLEENAALVNPYALVMDVSSVKVKPIALMEQYLPSTCEIVGTHPLFGPQSGKNGIHGLNFVLCPTRCKKETLKKLTELFQHRLQLKVLERTVQEHDTQMAYVQGITHFIGRALNRMDIPDVEQKTPAYQYLLDIKRNLGGDSWDLFLTIENENLSAKAVREEFLEELHRLNDELEN